MISGDPNLLKEGTEAHARLELQRAAVEQLDAFVWPQVHSWRDISRVAQENKYDVVTSQDPFWRGLVAWKLARRIGAKLNIQIHTDLAAQSFVRHVLARIVLRHADSIRVVSENIKKQVERMNVRASIHVHPIFVDLVPYRSLTHRAHPRFKKTLLWIGRFEEEKDPLAALSILEQVRHAGIDAGLIMLGRGSLEQKLHTRAKGLLSYVEFPGWQNPAPYLEMADVVISTSKHESYGASIIEALAAGLPVVAPDIGIAKEAGAIVVARSELAASVEDVLRGSTRGELRIALPNRDEWTRRWKETFV